jgi:hypothetical protein
MDLERGPTATDVEALLAGGFDPARLAACLLVLADAIDGLRAVQTLQVQAMLLLGDNTWAPG